MRYSFRAACGCHMGRIRKNNEDNFYFEGKCLELNNEGLRHPICMEDILKNGQCFAIFDGMGGENFGENASFAAARRLQKEERTLRDFLFSEKRYLERVTAEMNEAVRHEQNELRTDKMGTTVVCLYFSGRYVYVCNIGDSRAYRLRNGEFLQLTEDHVEKRPDGQHRKAPLTQHLGIDPEEMQIEPYIAKGEIRKGDVYLLCSDGLTDMLTNLEISDILLANNDVESCAAELIQQALEHGGRDNITVIVCHIV